MPGTTVPEDKFTRELRERVNKLLLGSPAVLKTCFVLDGVAFHGAQLGIVTMGLNMRAAGHKGIGLRWGEFPTTDKHGGAYNTGTDEMKFPDANYGDEKRDDHKDIHRAGIVHEAVHASYDAFKMDMPRGKDEAIAHLAQMMFFVRDAKENGRELRFPPEWEGPKFAHMKVAYDIAKNMVEKNLVVVSPADSAALQKALRNSDYAPLMDKPSQADGTWRHTSPKA